MFPSSFKVGSLRIAPRFAAILVIAALLGTSSASAHPGHGVTPEGDSVAHYLLEPVHGLGLVLVFAAAVAAVVMVIRARGRADQSQSHSDL